MYEALYNKYITKNQSRFAEPEEILSVSLPMTGTAGNIAGAPVYSDNGGIYVDSSDNHTIVIGQTGSKKTRTFCFSTVFSIINAGQSAIINDPKGEIYRRTAQRARDVGADVHVLNFRNPRMSTDCWNPFHQACEYYRSGRESMAIQCINDFTENVCADSAERTIDRYWTDCARALLKSLLLLLLDSVPEEYMNMTNLIQLSYEENCSVLKEILENMDPKTVAAFGLHSVLDLEADRTRSCVYSTLLSLLTPFVQDNELRDLLSDNTFRICEFGTKQKILYVIHPDEKETLGFLVNALNTQIYEVLVDTADKYPEQKLPVTVNFVTDEFANLPEINMFSNRISEARSRNIRYFLFIQSYEQLRQKYDKQAETILSNCSNWICYPSKEMEFLLKISAVCGREYDYHGVEHDLISPYDMQHLEKRREYAEVLVIRQGLDPYVTRLPDIDHIPEFSRFEESSLRADAAKRTRKSKFISFPEWVAGIDCKKFKYPFKKNPAKKASGAINVIDLEKELQEKFDELFGSPDSE